MTAVTDSIDVQFALQHALFINTQEAALPESFRNRAVAARDALAAAAAAFDEQMTIAKRDFRPGALERRQADIAAQADASIRQAVDSLLANLAEETVGARARLRPADPAKVDPTLEVETRAALLALDPLVRQEAYLEACRTGDARVIAATERALPFAPLCPPEVIDAGQRIRASAAAPQVVTMLRALETLQGEVEAAERTTRRRCRLVDSPDGLAVELPPTA